MSPKDAITSPQAKAGLPVAAVVVLLAITGSAPFLPVHWVLALVGVAALAGALTLGKRRVDRHQRTPRSPAWSARTVTELALYLSPVAILTIVFPIATHRITHVRVGGAPLTSLLLASSLTVPWLSQAVCLPLYRGVGDLISGGDMDKIERRLCQLWPTTYLQCLPVIVVFAIPVELATRWSIVTLGAYVLLCSLYVAFAQSLIVGIIARRRVLWAIGWTTFAAVLLIAPARWYLPPIFGLATQLVPLRRHLSSMRKRVVLPTRAVAIDLLRGILLGAVLWSDKLFLFLKNGNNFSVTDVFVALLPAILAYNFYFVRLAPSLDVAVENMRNAMEKASYGTLTARSKALSDVVISSVTRTAVIGAALAVVVTYLTGAFSAQALPLVATVAVASWLFMMTSILCYKLDYVGERIRPQIISAVHLVGCAILFLVLPVGPSLYAWFILLEGALFTTALFSCLNSWRTSEYTLFWRHATAW